MNIPDWYRQPPNDALLRKLGYLAWGLSAAVLALVGLMRNPALRIPLPEGVSLAFLQPIHASINALAALVLLAALVAIKQKRYELHRRLMLGALGLSVLFLLSYVAYHFTNTEVRFGDANHDGLVDAAEAAAAGSLRWIYLALLITHICFAGISLPLILLTLFAALAGRFPRHRNLAKWVFPMWLYVAITGPICYLLLRPYLQ